MSSSFILKMIPGSLLQQMVFLCWMMRWQEHHLDFFHEHLLTSLPSIFIHQAIAANLQISGKSNSFTFSNHGVWMGFQFHFLKLVRCTVKSIYASHFPCTLLLRLYNFMYPFFCWWTFRFFPNIHNGSHHSSPIRVLQKVRQTKSSVLESIFSLVKIEIWIK